MARLVSSLSVGRRVVPQMDTRRRSCSARRFRVVGLVKTNDMHVLDFPVALTDVRLPLDTRVAGFCSTPTRGMKRGTRPLSEALK